MKFNFGRVMRRSIIAAFMVVCLTPSAVSAGTTAANVTNTGKSADDLSGIAALWARSETFFESVEKKIDAWLSTEVAPWTECVFGVVFWHGFYLYDGSATALSRLGWYLESGSCFLRNPARAAALYREGAEAAEEAPAMLLGHLYLKGLGVERDIEAARHWFDLAVLYRIYNGKKDQINITHYIMGTRGIPLELAAAIDKGRRLLDGDGLSIYKLAVKLRDATGGLPRNLAAAGKLFYVANLAKKIPHELKHDFYVALLNNTFHTRDPADRKHEIGTALYGLFGLAGARRHPPSQQKIAEVFADGDLVKKDLFFAYVFFRVAQNNGLNVADEIKRIRPHLTDEQISEGEEDVRLRLHYLKRRYRGVVDKLFFSE